MNKERNQNSYTPGDISQEGAIPPPPPQDQPYYIEEQPGQPYQPDQTTYGSTPAQYPDTPQEQPPFYTAPSQDQSYQPYQPYQPGQTYQQTPPYTPSYDSPISYGSPVAQSGKAIWALVCGILSIVLTGFAIPGIVLGIIAIILATSAINSQGKDKRASAGRICGIIGLVLSCFVLASSITNSLTSSLNDTIDSEIGSLSDSYSSRDSRSYEPGTAKDEARVSELAESTMVEITTLDAAEKEKLGRYLSQDIGNYAQIAGQKVTLEMLGITETELADIYLSQIDYSFESSYTYTDHATVYVDIYYSPSWNHLSTFQESVTELNEDLDTVLNFSSKEELYAHVANLLRESITEEEPYYAFRSLDFEKNNGTWEVTDESYESMRSTLYGYSYTSTH